MRIAFVDNSRWQYTVEAPYQRPFGGSQSALCYLAVELARLGERITIFNGNQTTSENRNVELRNILEIEQTGYLNQFDVIVVLNRTIGRKLRRDGRISVPLVFWNQHNHDQQAVRGLARLNERKSWTRFAFVSEWQRTNFERRYWVPREKSRVMRNAVSPAFGRQAPAVPWFLTGEPPVLVYSSTPFRGLDVLLQAFPAIRAAMPGTRLRIFSSMEVYQVSADKDQYQGLYRQARAIDGVEYIGSVGQSRLATEFASAAALAYPSTFAETSCISVLEAMAAGAAVFTTRLGALPETTNGLASMVDWDADGSRLAGSFADMAVAALREAKEDPATALISRDARIKFVNDNYTWPARANEWLAWLSQFKHPSGAQTGALRLA